MKLYRTRGYDAPNGIESIHWDGTQADAAKCRKKLKELDIANIETTDVDVPTDKPSLLAWLNANVTGE